MDLLQTAMDRFVKEKIAQRIGFVTDFNPQTLSVAVCIRSIADPVRSGNVFSDFHWRGSIKDEKDATTIQDGFIFNKDTHGWDVL